MLEIETFAPKQMRLWLLQVVVCSFVYGGSKPKTTKQETAAKEDDVSEPQSSDKLASPGSEPPNQNYTASGTGTMWHGSRTVDVKSTQPHTGISLIPRYLSHIYCLTEFWC
jgi:hypothetical protein